MKDESKNDSLLYELRLNTKSLNDEAGTFEGYLSVYGKEDLQKDVVEPGAWRIARSPLPLLYRHDRNQLIGAIDELNETERGLFVKGHLNLAVERAREIYALMKEGLITGLSPGYRETSDSFVGNIRHILSADLHEASLTPFPANTDAMLSSYKEEGERYMTENTIDELTLGDEPVFFTKSVQASGLPLADGDVTWDQGAARQALNKWSGGDINKYKRAFLYYDGSGNTSGCKLPIATIIDGKLTAVPSAIRAAKARFNQTQSIPAEEKSRIQSILAAYSKKLGWDDDDDTDKGSEDSNDNDEDDTKGKEEAPKEIKLEPQEAAPVDIPPAADAPAAEPIPAETPPEVTPDNSLAVNADEIQGLIAEYKGFTESIKGLNELIDTRIKEYKPADGGDTTPNDDKTAP
jgi:phage prohead protease, HK97 family